MVENRFRSHPKVWVRVRGEFFDDHDGVRVRTSSSVHNANERLFSDECRLRIPACVSAQDENQDAHPGRERRTSACVDFNENA